MMKSIKRQGYKRWLPVIIIAVAVFIAWLLYWSKPKPPAVVVAEKAWLVKTETVIPGAYSPSVALYGQAGSLWSSELTAGVAADVVQVAVIEGDQVSKGQVLVRLDERDAKLALRQREAELAEAQAAITAEKTQHKANLSALPREKQLLALVQKEVTRLQSLVMKKAIAQSALDNVRQTLERQEITLTERKQQITQHKARLAQVRARLARSKALRDQAALALQRCVVKAPFNGAIARLPVAPGQRTRIGDPLVQLYDTDALVIRAQIPNRYVATLQQAIQQKTPIYATAKLAGQAINVTLLRLASEVAAGSGSVQGLFTFSASGQMVRQGLFVRLDLQLPALQEAIALPHEAIYGTNRVYRVDEEQRMRAVSVERVGEARISPNETRVLLQAKALPAQSKVVVTQLPNAIDGLLVRSADEGK